MFIVLGEDCFVAGRLGDCALPARRALRRVTGGLYPVSDLVPVVSGHSVNRGKKMVVGVCR